MLRETAVKEELCVSISSPVLLSFAQKGDLCALKDIPIKEAVILLGTGPQAVRDKFGCACIHWAAGNGHLDCLRWLIDVVKADPSDRALDSSRTPAHYAARNGQLHCVRYLTEECRCDMNALAKHGVSPFQLAVWQNHMETVEYLCDHPLVMADPLQINDFECGAVHWLATATKQAAGQDGSKLIPLAEWLRSRGCDFYAIQRSSHTALHKAAWAGHLVFCQWLHNTCGMFDDHRDDAGNYAADSATMGKHYQLAEWLRRHCSYDLENSLSVLGLTSIEALDAASGEILLDKVRAAYLALARLYHPDQHPLGCVEAHERFVAIKHAYDHLMSGGAGNQRNERHDINFMLTAVTSSSSSFSSSSSTGATAGEESKPNDENKVDCTAARAASKREEEGTDVATLSLTQPEKVLSYFKARLLATLLEYQHKGVPLSNLRKKWEQMWPEHPFPELLEMKAIIKIHRASVAVAAPAAAAAVATTEDCSTASNNSTASTINNSSRRSNKPSRSIDNIPKPKTKTTIRSFLREVAADCCYITEGGPGNEVLAIPITPHLPPLNDTTPTEAIKYHIL